MLARATATATAAGAAAPPALLSSLQVRVSTAARLLPAWDSATVAVASSGGMDAASEVLLEGGGAGRLNPFGDATCPTALPCREDGFLEGAVTDLSSIRGAGSPPLPLSRAAGLPLLPVLPAMLATTVAAVAPPLMLSTLLQRLIRVGAMLPAAPLAGDSFPAPAVDGRSSCAPPSPDPAAAAASCPRRGLRLPCLLIAAE